jgi:hypothetical protein
MFQEHRTPLVEHDPLGWPAARLAQAHAEAERELLAAVLADHTVGVALASREGVRRWHFMHADLRLMWIASGLCRRRDLVTLLRLIRGGLQGEYLWDLTRSRANAGASMRWSDAALVAFARAELRSEQLIVRFARRLLELDARLKWATALHQRLVAALDLSITSPPIGIYPAAPMRGAA